MKNTKWEIKPIKIGKQSGTTYCFRCKDYTNKILRENLTVLFADQINRDFQNKK